SFTIGGSSTDYCDCEVATTPLHPEPDFGYFPTNNTINTQNIPPAQLPSRENNKELLNLFF
ncbi:6537_t:CDS:1, partial [Gigaspora margarita]